MRGTEVSVRGLVVERAEGRGRSLNQSKFRGWEELGSAGPWTESGAEGELVLLNGLFYPGPQSGLVEGLDERLLGRVVL